MPPSASASPPALPHPAAQAGRELSNDARERIRPHIDDHIKKMKDLKQQAANSRVQRGAVTSY
tara:strand:+ start:435 stop:623 length:189 start_codon:yes stop_codon:yes gene_type:complete